MHFHRISPRSLFWIRVINIWVGLELLRSCLVTIIGAWNCCEKWMQRIRKGRVFWVVLVKMPNKAKTWQYLYWKPKISILTIIFMKSPVPWNRITSHKKSKNKSTKRGIFRDFVECLRTVITMRRENCRVRQEDSRSAVFGWRRVESANLAIAVSINHPEKIRMVQQWIRTIKLSHKQSKKTALIKRSWFWKSSSSKLSG